MRDVEKHLRDAYSTVTIVQCGLASAIRCRRCTKALLDEWESYLDAALKHVRALRKVRP